MNKLVAMFLTAVLMGTIGCATTRDSLRVSSDRLEARAHDFYTQLRYEGDDSHRSRISRDALALSDSTRDLRRAVDEHAATETINSHFDRVARDYDRLHEDFADEGYASQNRRVLQEFDRVTDAYRDVESSFTPRNARVTQEHRLRD